ncbi:hypothetical protein [Roseixanthobacter glucoisosaccharinicivorans]|uniref:hypothetical protein n=1 Tax=Roseixanthobacter glucoisosaccharinicivorans TaxID=3119923 RepID=UPI003727C414
MELLVGASSEEFSVMALSGPRGGYLKGEGAAFRRAAAMGEERPLRRKTLCLLDPKAVQNGVVIKIDQTEPPLLIAINLAT